MSTQRCCTLVRDGPDVAILDLEGEINRYTVAAFREALLRAIAEGASCVVIDATKVSLMDSTGLGVLVLGERRLRPGGGALAVAGGGRLGRLLEMTGLHEVFSLHASRAAALQAVRCGHAAVAPPAAEVRRQAHPR